MAFYPDAAAPAGPWLLLNSGQFGGQAARTVVDAVTNGTTTITSATASFSSTADVGKLAIITGTADGDAAAGNYFAAPIASVVNPSTAVLASAPVFTESSCNLVIGADNKNALNAFLAAISGDQGHIGAGVYCTSGQHTVPGGTLLSGDGYDVSSVNPNFTPQKGSVLLFGGSGNPTQFLLLGASGYTEGLTNSQLQNLSVDACNLAQTAVLAQGNRCVLQNCQIQRGIFHAFQNNGGSCWIFNNYIGQQNAGDVFYNSGSDAHILGNILRQPGSGGACLRTVNVIDFLFVGNHSFAGYNGVVSSSYPCNNLIIQNSSSAFNMDNFAITGNIFDGVYGHAIVLTVSGGGNARIADACITGNSFLAVTGFPAGTFSVLYLDAQASGFIRAVTLDGNTIRGVEASSNNWQYLVTPSAGTGTIGQVSVMGNTGMGVGAFWPATWRPDGGRAGNIVTPTNVSGTGQGSTNDGTATFSGTGSQTAFVINHGLAAAPITVTVTAGSAAAAGAFSWSANATQITITFLAAPANGTNNVLLSWFASL